MSSLFPAFPFLPYCCLAVSLHSFTLHFPVNLLFPCKVSQIPKQCFCQHCCPFLLMSNGNCCCLQGLFFFLLVSAHNWVLCGCFLSSFQHSSSRVMHIHTQTLHTILNAGMLLTDCMKHKELEEDQRVCPQWDLSLPAAICLAQLAVRLGSVGYKWTPWFSIATFPSSLLA